MTWLNYYLLTLAVNYNAVYNAWNPAMVIVNVIDTNDQVPTWVIPFYTGSTGTQPVARNKYFGIVNNLYGAETDVLAIEVIYF